jgi:hypothetical protein
MICGVDSTEPLDCSDVITVHRNGNIISAAPITSVASSRLCETVTLAR